MEIKDNELDMWNENVGQMIEVVDNLKDFKSKWLSFNPKAGDSKTTQREKKEKQRHMLRLITKQISTWAYVGGLTKAKFKGSKKPVVNKLNSRTLNFEWSEEFQILFELGVIKKLSPGNGNGVDNKNLDKSPVVRQNAVNKGIKLSTIQQKLDILVSIH